jgi:hypothetical protein
LPLLLVVVVAAATPLPAFTGSALATLATALCTPADEIAAPAVVSTAATAAVCTPVFTVSDGESLA